MAEGRQKKYHTYIYWLALIVFIGTNLISLFIFHRSPHIHDEAAYDFQAKIFLLGRLYVTSPCAKEFFDFPHVINNGRWYSQYPPGFPALLAAGHIFKAPWIINPVFAALFIILVFFLGKELFNEKTGFLAALLTSLSYWFLILSSTLMSHTAHLFFCTLFLLFFIRSIKTPDLKNGFIAGFAFFMAFLIRPYESVLFAIAPAIYILFKFLKEPKKYLKATMAMAIMAFLAVAVLMVYNYGTTGNPLKMGYIERYGPDHGLGFGRKGYTGIPHTFMKGAQYVGKNIEQLHLHLFGWPISSLLGVLIYLFFFIRGRSEQINRPLEFLQLFIILLTCCGLIIYWGSFALLGARMYFQLIGILAILTAAGLIKTIEILVESRLPRMFTIISLTLISAAFVTYSALIRLPNYQKLSFEFYIPELTYPDFLYFNKGFEKTIENLPIDNSVVLIKPLYLPRRFFPDGGWTAGFVQNHPLFRNKIIYGHFKRDNLLELFRCYPEKRFFLFVYTVKNGMLFEISRINNSVSLGPPLTQGNLDKNEIALIDKPSDFFQPYSPEFQEFIGRFDKIPYLDFDLKYLADLASDKERSGDFGQAALIYEAILQLEPYLENRINMYKRLQFCYFKLKKTDRVKQIIWFLHENKTFKIKSAFPDKGF